MQLNHMLAAMEARLTKRCAMSQKVDEVRDIHVELAKLLSDFYRNRAEMAQSTSFELVEKFL